MIVLLTRGNHVLEACVCVRCYKAYIIKVPPEMYPKSSHTFAPSILDLTMFKDRKNNNATDFSTLCFSIVFLFFFLLRLK